MEVNRIANQKRNPHVPRLRPGMANESVVFQDVEAISIALVQAPLEIKGAWESNISTS
jgi:hypothetical protein